MSDTIHADTDRVAIVMFYVSGDKYYVMLTNDGYIHGFKTLKKGLRYFENAYDRAHDRSLTASTGAMLAFMQLSPKVLETTLEEFKSAFLDVTDINAVELSGEGFIRVGAALCDGPMAAQFYEQGTSPRLIRTNEERLVDGYYSPR